MHVDTQISRGLERILARNAGAYLEGMYGLSGLGACDTFGELENLSHEAGVPNAAESGRKLRRAHRCACERMKAALPVAVAVQSALEEANGPDPLPLSQQADTLSGIEGLLGATTAAKITAKAQKAAAKAQKKIAKIEAKEAKQEAKVAAKVAKLQAAGKTAKADKVIAKDAKQDAKVAAKLVKLTNVISAANQAVQTIAEQSPATPGAPTASTPVTPTQTAAAVLANQTGLPATPAVSQLAQEVVANATNPGSAVPTASLTTSTMPTGATGQPSFALPSDWGDTSSAPAADDSGGGMFGNIPPVALIAGAGVLAFLLLGRKKGR
jgi:hypothetical protein